MKKILSGCIYIVLLYIYLNNPLLSMTGGIGASKLLYPILGVVILLNNRLFARYLKVFKTESRFYLFFILCAAFQVILGGEVAVLRSNLVALVEVILLPFLFVILSDNLFRHCNLSVLRAVLIVGAVGSVISCISITFPQVNYYIINVLTVVPKKLLSMYEYRGFGLSDELTYGYGIIQGVILVLGMCEISSNKWFFAFLPFMFISIIFNARTGIVVAIVGIICYTLVQRKSINLLFQVIAVIVLLYTLPYVISDVGVSSASMEWGMQVFDQITDVVQSKSLDSGTAGILFGRMFMLPENLFQWIFGRGYMFFGKSRILGFDSDVGFINQLNYGGLLYFLPMMFMVVYIVKRLWKCGYKEFAVLFAATFVIANIKGPFLLNSGGFRLLMYIYILILWNQLNYGKKKYSLAPHTCTLVSNV